MATGTRARRAGGAAPGWALTRAVLYGRSAPFFRARPGQCLLPAELAGPRTRAAGGPTPYGLASPSPHLSAAPALPGGPRSTGPGRACPRPSVSSSVCSRVRPSVRPSAPGCQQPDPAGPQGADQVTDKPRKFPLFPCHIVPPSQYLLPQRDKVLPEVSPEAEMTYIYYIHL
ncbi:synapsin-1-like isoform X3 [Artibeus jamaicensis]|uniref:synapsin-1-like isoform X3 n=1 Tax=Artibeus jamaicensis TaxID=9417 RepID=UPI00187BE1B2|nr:synapsin-1-like isoform X3 [Artibeus jamaicensis]